MGSRSWLKFGKQAHVGLGRSGLDAGSWQADAIKLLYKAVIPELKGEVLTGEDGAPLVEPTRHDELYTKMEVARRVAFLMAGGIDAKREIADLDAPGVEPEPVVIPEPEPEPETAAEAPTEPAEPTEPPPPPPGNPKRRDRAVRPPERF